MRLARSIACFAGVVLVVFGSAPCACNFGNVDIETPQCVCACFADYLQPNCLYTADELVPIGVYLTANVSSFQASEWIQTLTWALGVEAPQDIDYKFARRAQVNGSYARFLLRGTYAQQLLWDFKSNAKWLSDVGIVGVWEEMILAPSSGAPDADSSMVVIQSTDGKIIVTLNTLAWLLGATACTVAVTCFDWLFLHNIEERINDLELDRDDFHEHMRQTAAQRQVRMQGDTLMVQAGPRSNRNVANPLVASEYDTRFTPTP